MSFAWNGPGSTDNKISFGMFAADDLLTIDHSGNGVFAGSVSATLYKGPATAPTGACSDVGWAFSQDGHISYCNGSAWTQKM